MFTEPTLHFGKTTYRAKTHKENSCRLGKRVEDTMERERDRGTQATFWKKPGLPGGFTIVVGTAGGDNDTAESSLHL